MRGDDPVEVPRDALTGCDREACAERFVVVFAAEGLSEELLEMPVRIEAHVVYEHAIEAPQSDVLSLMLE